MIVFLMSSWYCIVAENTCYNKHPDIQTDDKELALSLNRDLLKSMTVLNPASECHATRCSVSMQQEYCEVSARNDKLNGASVVNSLTELCGQQYIFG